MDTKSKENSSEWVGASTARSFCERKKDCAEETITPSDRVLRSSSRTKLVEGQATDAHLVTENVIGSVMKLTKNEANKLRSRNSQTQSDCKTTHKISLSTQPESHHRTGMNKSPVQLSSSFEDDLKDDILNTDYCHLTHPNRVTNLMNIERELKVQIKFPPSNDKIWKKINEELEIIIPKIFNKTLMNKLSSSELSQKFDNWIHQYFLEKFGQKAEKALNQDNNTRKKRPNKILMQLRKRKKQCKAARKALIKAGLKETKEYEIICKEWLSLVRQHNRLRLALNRKHAVKEKLNAEKAFRKDPHKFAENLFNKTQKSGKPTFSAETAQNYFEKTYRDEDRKHVYTPLPEFERPPFPDYLFSLRCPTEKELIKSTRRKRNGASPGLNGITYVPYKKCASIIKFIAKLGQKIWKTKDVPLNWAIAYIILLSKSEDLSIVSEFRPIALTCCGGKIFFSVLADKLQVFMIKNNYISREVQKGFLAGTPGCIEHTFALLEAIRDAKDNHRQIIITWLDLANAYGSVRHNLIQFALNWYHVPKLMQELIFDYYEKLCAFVVTSNWSTGYFLLDIGLFQGCVLSTNHSF
jgi:hypothetical protein